MNTKVISVYDAGPGEPYRRVKLSDGSVVREHRFMMEQKLGRKLDRNELVHHKDGDKTNNNLANLELLGHGDHIREHKKPAATKTLTCPGCGKKFKRTLRYIRTKNKLGQKHFMCGRKCRMPRKGM